MLTFQWMFACKHRREPRDLISIQNPIQGRLNSVALSYSSILQLNTSAQYSSSILQLNTADYSSAHYFISILHLNTSAQYFSSILQLNTSAQYFSLILQFDTSAQYFSLKGVCGNTNMGYMDNQNWIRRSSLPNIFV